MRKKLAIIAVAVLAAALMAALYPRGKAEAPAIEVRATSTVPAMAGESVYASMMAYASSSDFSFTAERFDGLGYFIQEIGGRPNANGFYWTLYVNGKYSEKGASETVVKQGDIIEWRYEKM